MWKRNFKSTQAYHQHKAKGGGLHIGISFLLEYEIIQNASLRLIWSHTAFEQPLELWRHQYPQHFPTLAFFASVWHHVPWGSQESQSLGSLGVSGVSESQNHELYYSRDSFVNSFQQLSLLVQPRPAFKTISSETVNASCWMIQKVGDTKKYNVFKYLKPRMLFILHKSVSTLQPDIIIYVL